MKAVWRSTVRLLAIGFLILHPLNPMYAQTRTSEIVNAANGFLATLSPAQRRQVL
jgi:hypothetical protein